MKELKDAYAESRLKAGLERISVALQDSWIAGRARKAYASVDSAAPTSRTNRTARKTRAVARSSWIHAWLTEEPQPATIEIDLQDSFFVSPSLRLLETLGSLLGPARTSSHLNQATHRLIDRLAPALTNSVAMAYLAAVLQPPGNTGGSQEP